MTTEQKNQKIQALIKKLDLKNCSKYAPEPNQGDRYPILNEKYTDKLWIKIQKENYLVIIRGNKEIGISKIIHEFIGKDYDHNDGQNDIWHFDSFNDVEKIIYAYAGVKKQNMEQEFREYLENCATLVPATINTYVKALGLNKDVYANVKTSIDFPSFYEIKDIDIYLEQYEKVKDVIPNQGNTNDNDNGDDNGYLNAAFGKYKLFLQSLEIVKQMDLYDVNPDDFSINQNVHWYFEINDRNGRYPIKATVNDIFHKIDLSERHSTDQVKTNLRKIFGKSYINFIDTNDSEKPMVDEKLDEKLDETIKLLKSKNQIILQGSPGTGKTRFAKQIAEKIIGCISPEKLILQELNSIKNKPIDFVDGKDADYKFTIIDISGDVLTVKGGGNPREVSIQKVQELINRKEIDIKYYGDLFFEKGIAQYLLKILDKKLIKAPTKKDKYRQYKLIQFHPAYSYEDFVRGIVAETNDKWQISYKVKNKVLAEMAENARKDPDSDFVLVIDEINRANLSAVLGELIYALEYRGQPVESMYAIGDSREIILPENLYIIGTMNTADRSVGHIDYAIRRRFAFVDVKTDESVIPEAANTLFAEIKQLFDEQLSEEFDKDDVMIGHSYFLGDDLAQALKYEIKPILCEYVKDGVLTCTKDTINALNVN